MENNIQSTQESIQERQIVVLYDGIKLTCATSIVTSIVIGFFIGPWSLQTSTHIWTYIIVLIYSLRLIDGYLYSQTPPANRNALHWEIRYKTGIYAATAAWASFIWIAFPENQFAYQAVIVIIMGGIVGGNIVTTQCYDKSIVIIFQGIVFTSIEIRLITENQLFSMELAVITFLLFGFLTASASKIGGYFYNSFNTNKEIEDSNLRMIKTSEEIAHIGYWKWDMRSRRIKISPSLATMWGYAKTDLDIFLLYDFIHNDDWEKVRNTINSTPTNDGETSVEYKLLHLQSGRYLSMKQVTKRVLGNNGMDHILGTVQNVSEIKSAEQRIYDMAYFDALTKLANRAHFHEHLRKQLVLVEQKFALLFIDLDDFKAVNDSFGHESGDIYLKKFAKHLETSLRASDFIARIGGDEFCVVMHDMRSDDEVVEASKRCQAFMQQSITIGNHSITPKMSIGIAVYPEHGKDINSLLRSADMAMYTVKNNGKHGFAFFSAQMQSDNLDRLKMEADLRDAIINQEFELWYQPKISLDHNNINSVEALIRWNHPSRGLVRPDIFIGLAEQVGLIDEIGEWVLKTACKQLEDWKVQGLSLKVAVNISSGHFESPGFVDVVKQSLSNFGITKDELELEITESMSRNPKQHIRICRELRKAGVRIAIDDFGTGYSSLSVLTQLEVDTLKIDRSFIMGIPEKESSILMVRAIMDMSAGLGFDIVAEGVETLEQLQMVMSMGCPFVQGYYFSKPVTADKIPLLIDTDWLSRNTAKTG